MTPIIGIGAGGHAAVVVEILQLTQQWNLVGLLDSRSELWGTQVLGVPILGDDVMLPELYAQGIRHAFLGVGSVGEPTSRKRLYEQIHRQGFQLIAAIHPRAIVAPSASYGEGATIMAGAIVNTRVQMGANVIINSGAIIEHDCVIGDHVHVATGVKMCGTIRIADAVHVGAGATIRQGLSIGEGAVIGAGAVVVSDVQPWTVVGGVPARRLPRRQLTAPAEVKA